MLDGLDIYTSIVFINFASFISFQYISAISHTAAQLPTLLLNICQTAFTSSLAFGINLDAAICALRYMISSLVFVFSSQKIVFKS